jgi:hypothetical protein
LKVTLKLSEKIWGRHKLSKSHFPKRQLGKTPRVKRGLF